MLYADRVQETTQTSGTTTLVLGGAVPGFRAFASAFGAHERVRYAIVYGEDWETGEGIFTAPSTLTRERVFASSNAGALVNFPPGHKLVWSDLPAQAIADIGLTLAFRSLTVPQ